MACRPRWPRRPGGARVRLPRALADDLSGLPTTCIDAGSADFRDEDTDYATRIRAAGGQAALHVWGGPLPRLCALCPQAYIPATARRTRTDWLARLLLRV